MKKLLLSLGAATTLVAPVLIVASCGSSSQSTTKNVYNGDAVDENYVADNEFYDAGKAIAEKLGGSTSANISNEMLLIKNKAESLLGIDSKAHYISVMHRLYGSLLKGIAAANISSSNDLVSTTMSRDYELLKEVISELLSLDLSSSEERHNFGLNETESKNAEKNLRILKGIKIGDFSEDSTQITMGEKTTELDSIVYKLMDVSWSWLDETTFHLKDSGGKKVIYENNKETDTGLGFSLNISDGDKTNIDRLKIEYKKNDYSNVVKYYITSKTLLHPLKL